VALKCQKSEILLALCVIIRDRAAVDGKLMQLKLIKGTSVEERKCEKEN
jgi:hypothetical protein